MGEFVRLIIEIVQYFWPFHIVHTSEKAGYYIFGKFWKVVDPGCKIVIPFFTSCHNVSVAEAPIATGVRDVTLSDGTTLSYDGQATVEVTDVDKALNNLYNYDSAAPHILASVLSNYLCEVDPDRLRPGRRGRLLNTLEDEANKIGAPYGLKFSNIRFTSFVLKAKTHRLLMDQQQTIAW